MSDLPAYPSAAAEREDAQSAPGGAIAYAGWWQRAAALLIDGLLVSVVVLIAFVLAAVVAAINDGAGLVVLFLAVVLAVVGPIWYHVYLTGAAPGQTVGKRALGIRVRHADEDRAIGYGPAAGRYLVTVVFGLFVVPALLDYLWPLWDDRNQTLHDKAVNSIVVRD